ncbi:MAG TPA: FGGY family carbohydrate kinase [Bacteroidales bacterium]|jgi:sugar (pentulose or hexulose) kinase|nr:carbohydrate kinase [Bacteroidales bacterium]OQB65652.1 MAG: Rhamnulokinase [Bacteroidetes bacterium ADurb.Bin145]NMD03857.1 carbohydrate kinase [Bacteroidales bacterium]HOU02644.1 FGGY family carbohydrate kinase [Bacteroidales bacterium]HQG63087.1 FGGY family carbohydrate kinase [Bacteroidales bacterium]
MREKVIAIYDIGKTNKKIILFNYDLKPVYEIEEKFTEVMDDDGFECDDIEHIEKWIKDSIRSLIHSEKFELTAINFATYGATLVYLDKYGKRLTPVYNYLKPIDDRIPEKVYRKNGGQDEFCRRTASPALGMLNSGMQALWLKYTKPQIFSEVAHILHFPQYLSYLLTGKIFSEHTSIGCHTAMWDFDEMKYHKWIKEEGLHLPEPADINTLNNIVIEGKNIKAGIGIHDSSASLAPYFKSSDGRFILISTGTWCINMNPFNSEKLTAEQLDRDCLCYLSITKQPVKSSRLFLGHFHEVLLNKLIGHFNVEPGYFQRIQPDKRLLDVCRQRSRRNRFFFDEFPYSRKIKDKLDFYTFKSFEEGYHQLMVELSELTTDSVDLVIPDDNNIENIYITGGFSKNKLFLDLIANAYPMKNVYTSEVFNATALGAALVVMDSLNPDIKPVLNLGLNRC